MNVFIKIGASFEDVTSNIVSEITFNKRIDQVLDSGGFSMITNKVLRNIPPFTLMYFENEAVKEYWFCSSQSNKIVPLENYNHNVELIELTKITECFLIGSKAFSVIDTDWGNDNYNTNYKRIEILTKIINTKYGVSFKLDESLKEMTEQREYSFGSGTTFFDCLKEIMATENRFPKVLSYENGAYLLGAINYNEIETNEVVNIDKFETLSYEQDTDEYCSQIEVEMDNVVDRDTLQTVVLTPRSSDEAISADNASLILPSKIESVESLGILAYGPTGPTIKVPRNYFSGLPTSWDGTGTLFTASLSTFDYLIDVNLKNQILSWANSINSNYDNICVYADDDFFLFTFFVLSESSTGFNTKDFVYVNVLDKTNYDLLEATVQPYFLYYENGSDEIKGLYLNEHDGFWQKMLFGEKGPFLKELVKTNADQNYYLIKKYVDFDSKATQFYTYDGVLSCNSFHQYYPNPSSHKIDENPLNNVFCVNYYTSSPLYCQTKKNIPTINEDVWKVSARSYNNGANTVDYNQLIPAMKRSANMLGLMKTSLISRSKFEIGTRTTLGYVISINDSFKIVNNKIIDRIYTYDCCDNYQQIAAAIGIQTQYEATNLPQKGIINRYVSLLASLPTELYQSVCKDARTYMMMIELDTRAGKRIAKAGQLLKDNTRSFLICEASDNYAFDYQKSSGFGGYYKNNPVSYGDSSNYLESVSSLKIDILGLNVLSADELSNLPLITMQNTPSIASFNELYIYKDPREKLVFSIELIDNGDTDSLDGLFTITVDKGISSYSVYRASSIKYSVGNISNNSFVYYGDSIWVTLYPKAGYYIPEQFSDGSFGFYIVDTGGLSVNLKSEVKSTLVLINKGTGVKSVHAEVTSSPLKGNVGSVENNSLVYYGDVVVATPIPEDNYYINENEGNSITKTVSDAEIEMFCDFGFTATQKDVFDYNPVILIVSFDKDSQGFNTLTYNIANNNSVAVEALISVDEGNNVIKNYTKTLGSMGNCTFTENMYSDYYKVTVTFKDRKYIDASAYYLSTWQSKIKLTIDDGILNYAIRRNSSNQGKIGIITLDDTIYYGDVIGISANARIGYKIIGDASREYTVGEDGLSISYTTDVVSLPLNLVFDSGIESYSVLREKSTIKGLAKGYISDGSIIYYGDVILVKATPKSDYYLIEQDFEDGVYYNISVDDCSSGSYGIGVSTNKKQQAVAPVITITRFERDSSGFYYLSYTIRNNNYDLMTAHVELSGNSGQQLISSYDEDIDYYQEITKNNVQWYDDSIQIEVTFNNRKYISSWAGERR